MIAIIKGGNAGSVKNAFKYLGEDCIITLDPLTIEKADRVILPGVGAFGDVMKQLKPLRTIIKKAIEQKPFLGICVGMQVLFENSEESPEVKGLSLLKGQVKKFQAKKVPQIGWNKMNNNWFYFVNSYYCAPDDDIAIGITDYEGEFVSAVKSGNITAVQFHPEKSGQAGLDFLKGWLKC